MVNLMEEAIPKPEPEHLIVDVKDHDINIPSDLGNNNQPFWQQESIKVWLYVLAGAIVVLITVFALLSKQSSLFQGRTKLSSVNSVTVEDPDNTDLEGFNSQAAIEEGETDGTLSGEGDFDSTESGGEPEIDINDIIAETTDNGDGYDDGLDDLLDDGGLDILDIDDMAPVQDDTTFEGSEALDSYPAANEEVEIVSEIIEEEIVNEDLGPSLDSNTEEAVLVAPEMQGDTGPVPFLAFFPAFLYAYKNRSNKYKT